MIETKEILCSENPQSDRMMSMYWRYPKFLHQESLRHRTLYIEDCLYDPDFSFSVSSSRAIPFQKMLTEASDPLLQAHPEVWGVEQKGMSPGDELDDTTLSIDWLKVRAELGWLRLPNSLRDDNYITARECAKRLWAIGGAFASLVAKTNVDFTAVHKSIANRQIETYIHVNCLVSGTTRGWMNFYGLRLDKAADPTLRILAESAWRIWNESKPKLLQPNEWHLPYVDDEYLEEINQIVSANGTDVTDLARKVSTACSAHLSYMSFEDSKRMTVSHCCSLHDRFVNSVPLHASPMEHQATPDEWHEVHPIKELFGSGKDGSFGGWGNPLQAGNLGEGWRQYRKMLPGEALALLPEAYR